MPRYLLTLRYVGTAYCGWQVQNNARSVQQTVQDAMESLLGVRPRLTGCSRTDAGVHAREFCAHFDAALPMPADRLPLALNTRLPDDVAALSCREVADDFHARYACEGKTYCYQILCSRLRDPFLEGYAWQVSVQALDQPLLDRAAGVFVGRHDFRGFCAERQQRRPTPSAGCLTAHVGRGRGSCRPPRISRPTAFCTTWCGSSPARWVRCWLAG